MFTKSIRAGVLLLTIPALLNGCAQISTVPDPGEHSAGMRYYLPATVLRVSLTVTEKKGDTAPAAQGTWERTTVSASDTVRQTKPGEVDTSKTTSTTTTVEKGPGSPPKTGLPLTIPEPKAKSPEYCIAWEVEPMRVADDSSAYGLEVHHSILSSDEAKVTVNASGLIESVTSSADDKSAVIAGRIGDIAVIAAKAAVKFGFVEVVAPAEAGAKLMAEVEAARAEVASDASIATFADLNGKDLEAANTSNLRSESTLRVQRLRQARTALERASSRLRELLQADLILRRLATQGTVRLDIPVRDLGSASTEFSLPVDGASLRVSIPGPTPAAATSANTISGSCGEISGILYRVAVPRTVRLVLALPGDPRSFTTVIPIPDGTRPFTVPMQRGLFTKSEHSIVLDAGVLKEVHSKRPSEVLGFLEIPYALASKVLELPSELFGIASEKSDDSAGAKAEDGDAKAEDAAKPASPVTVNVSPCACPAKADAATAAKESKPACGAAAAATKPAAGESPKKDDSK